MSEPRTEAGRALAGMELFGLSGNAPVGYYEADITNAILAIEAEASRLNVDRLAGVLETVDTGEDYFNWTGEPRRIAAAIAAAYEEGR